MAGNCSRLGKMPLLYCSECLLFILCISTDMSNVVCSIRPDATSIGLPQLHPSSTVEPQPMQVAMTVSEPAAIVPVQPDPVQPEAVIAVINESNTVIDEVFEPQPMQVAMTVSEPAAIVPVQPEAVITVINESNYVISEPYTSA